jgi:hypothetical protein
MSSEFKQPQAMCEESRLLPGAAKEPKVEHKQAM